MQRPHLTSSMRRFRVKLATVCRRIPRDWAWFNAIEGGRKRLGLQAPSGRRYWFSTHSTGTFLTPIHALPKK